MAVAFEEHIEECRPCILALPYLLLLLVIMRKLEGVENEVGWLLHMLTTEGGGWIK